ncbi:hypothetical protein BA190_24420 [Labrys sp. WJW]|uniref:L,D-transpeptidase n=1 Tax=Labrys sp. WJW TaxID=1737983 RepID=UPI00082BF2CB|nr:L,D-transpeptidase [Labrys sp. WJW]OCC02207.1 hypothetical protein BA190_24420 [Labrys sp. WJW]
MILARSIILLALPLMLASCVTTSAKIDTSLATPAVAPQAGAAAQLAALPAIKPEEAQNAPTAAPETAEAIDPHYAALYAGSKDGAYAIKAVNLASVAPRFWRREVAYDSSEKTGTIIVDPNKRFLYLIQGNGKALRYGVGVGKVADYNFQGEAIIARKATWPRWTPTPTMIARNPKQYGRYRAGMAGGPGNPLGARALYLYSGGRDTLYRLHGTTNPSAIGTKVSSGCIRLTNQDIIDLYKRIPVGTKVIVLPVGSSRSA